MEHILLDRETNDIKVNLELQLQDVKILYNACVDILNEYPEMLGYEMVAEELKRVIQSVK